MPRIEVLEDRCLLSATISGTVFEDTNGDGVHDAGELGIADVQVYLDQNNNGVFDAGDIDTTTDANGAYQFSGLADGTYEVAQVLDSGWMQTSPGPATSPELLGDVLYGIPISNSANPSTGLAWANNSLYQLVYPREIRKINPSSGDMEQTFLAPSGYSYWDLTFDGESFWGAPSLKGTDAASEIVQFDINGVVGEILDAPDGLRVIAIAWDGNAQQFWLAGIDSDNPGLIRVDTMSEDGSSSQFQFNLDQDWIGGMTFDGRHLWVSHTQDNQNVYKIDPSNGNILDSLAFTDLPSSLTFGLAFDGSALWTLHDNLNIITQFDRGVPGVNSAPVANGNNLTGLNFGQFELASFAGTFFEDLDENGTQDAGEPGLEGWRIFIDVNGNNQFDLWERSTLTDANGAYQFTGLRPGSYSVTSSREPGWVATTASPITVNLNSSGETLAVPDAGYSLQSLGPFGPEQILNDTTTSNVPPSVAVDADGNYATAWSDANGVFMRLFNADGTPRTGEIHVNSVAGGGAPDIAMTGDGRFAVGYYANGGLVVKLFDETGIATSGEIEVWGKKNNQFVALFGIDMDAEGNFVILYRTWRGNFLDFNFDLRPISVQRFNAQGTPQGQPVQVADPNNYSFNPDIAMAPDGRFTVVWSDYDNILIERYSADGSKIDQLVSGSGIDLPLLNPTVEMNTDGNIVVAWENRSLDPDRNGRLAEVFYSDGTSAGEAFRFTNTGPGGGGENTAQVAIDDEGTVAVVYWDQGVRLQLFDFDGTPQTGEVLVNTTLQGTIEDQMDLSMTRDGNFVVAWRNGNDIHAQRYQAPPPPPAAPELSISDVSITEGDSGTDIATFTVTRTGDTSGPVTVDYATADNTATAGSDYVGIVTTQLTFIPGETMKTFDVSIKGDLIDEGDETFFVNLSNATGATIADTQGVGTIVDDDAVIVGPSITSVSPPSASPGEQLTVIITGTGFVDGATVDFGTKVNVQSVTFVSETELRVVIKVHRRATEGSRDVTVTNPDGSSDTRTDGFTVGTASTSAQSGQSPIASDLNDAAFASDLDQILDP